MGINAHNPDTTNPITYQPDNPERNVMKKSMLVMSALALVLGTAEVQAKEIQPIPLAQQKKDAGAAAPSIISGDKSATVDAKDKKAEKSKEAKTDKAKDAKKENPFKEVTAEDIVKMKKDTKNLVIVDARGGKDFDGVMIEGAVNLPADKADAKSFAKIAPVKDVPIVFYCQSTKCPASELEAYKAHENGYTKLYHYAGGIEDWKAKKLSVTKPEAAAAESKDHAKDAAKDVKKDVAKEVEKNAKPEADKHAIPAAGTAKDTKKDAGKPAAAPKKQ